MVVTTLCLHRKEHPSGRWARRIAMFRCPFLHEEVQVTPEEMLALFRRHRDAEARRNYDEILETFADHCYLATAALGTRSDGREATRAAYVAYFTAFPDLAPEDEGFAFGDDALVSWGHLRGTSGGEWLGVAPTGGTFDVPFTNVTTFVGGRMAGETIYFDLATLCEQARLPLEEVRAAARARTGRTRR